MNLIYEAYLNEARHIDVAYAIKDLKDFNRKFTSKDPSAIDIKTLVTSVIKNLGFKTSKFNMENLTDHISTLLMIKHGSLPTNKSDVTEFYKFLK